MLAIFCKPKPKPTPNAPPNTDSTVKSMPTKGSAIKIDSTTAALEMILDSTIRRLMSMCRLFISCVLSQRANHVINSRITPTHNSPVNMVHTLKRLLPTEKLKPSSQLIIHVSTPEIHSTKHSHKPPAAVRSSQSIQ